MKASNAHMPSLGIGLRLVQVALACEVALCYANTATIDPLGFAYDLSLFRGLFGVTFSVLAIWMIERRAAAARPFACGCMAVSFALALVDVACLGAGGQIAAAVGEGAAAALLAAQAAVWLACGLYLAASTQVRRSLTLPLDALARPGRALPAGAPMAARMRTWPFWRDIAIYFIAFSYIGHWAEIAFCLLIRAGVFMGDYDPANHMLWDQWLYPFSAEGTALALVVLLLFPFKEWLMGKTGGRVAIALPISFAVNALVCTSIDFTCGITANADYHLWDYRALPFNFMGQIVLQNSLVYSLAATLIVWVVYPLMDKGMARLPAWLADALFWALAAGYGFLALLHFLYLGPEGWVFG